MTLNSLPSYLSVSTYHDIQKLFTKVIYQSKLFLCLLSSLNTYIFQTPFIMFLRLCAAVTVLCLILLPLFYSCNFTNKSWVPRMDPPFLTQNSLIAHVHYSTSDLTATVWVRLREANSLLQRQRSERDM